MLVLLTHDAVLMSLHPRNDSCCMPCVHYDSITVLSLGTLLSTGMYRPCMYAYTATVSDIHFWERSLGRSRHLYLYITVQIICI